METQVRIKRIIDWVFPYFGNRHTMPYGNTVNDSEVCYSSAVYPEMLSVLLEYIEKGGAK